MARFAYTAIDADGRERKGALTAPSETAARAQLQQKRLMPVRVAREAAGAAAQSAQKDTPRAVGGASLSHGAQLVFVRQLATLIEASIPVDEALRLIGEQQETAQARRIVADVHDGVLEGQRLADAMARHPKSFPPMLRAAVAGGERSGALGAVLSRLADYLQRSHALRTKIATALIYPAALSLVAITVVSCLMIFVVPSLAEQFKSFNTALPVITQVLIAISGFLAQFWPFVLAAIAGALFVLRAIFAQPAAALARDRALLGLPLFGKQIRAVNASRFARAAATLTASGLPVLDSVRAARDAAPNRYMARVIDAMSSRIEEGETLSGAMRAAGVFPPLLTTMTASGEGSGQVSSMLEKAADHLDQSFEAFTTAALSLFEPAVIIAMGAMVAGIVLAIMLPILQLNQLAIG